MRKARRGPGFVGVGLCIAVALLLMTVGLASCGGAKVEKQSKKSGAEKLPPGVTEGQADQSSGPSSSSSPSSASTSSQTQTQSTAPTQTQQKTPSASAILYGGQFKAVNATRPTTNKSVISSSGREVKGDYLEVEFNIQNVAPDHLVDLSQYSFRLKGPGIAASTYSDYYGTVGTYGKYVSTNEISATLLGYSDLQPVTCKVKVGELIDKVFVFFDLNPENVARNPNVTKDNTSLIIYKASGTEYGTSVTVPLTGYPD